MRTARRGSWRMRLKILEYVPPRLQDSAHVHAHMHTLSVLSIVLSCCLSCVAVDPDVAALLAP